MKKIYYRKLIRDKIPEKIQGKGSECETRKLSRVEFEKELLKKVGEESSGLLQAKNKREIIEEITDVLDVVDEILKLKKITPKEIAAQKQQNLEKKGGFEKRLYLVWSSDADYQTNEKMGKKG